MSRSAAAYQKFTEDEIRKANSVDILSLARGYGYEPEKAGRKAVHMKHSGGLYIFPENNRFFQWTGPDDGVKGGAIDFVMREENLSFPEAVGKLIGKEFSPSVKQVVPYEKKEREPLVLPEKADNMKRAYWYLVSVRGISPKIVSHFMNRKMIYQEKKYGNCVFVGYDAEGTARYCSMRAARDNSSFKMDATGSDKSYPFFHEGKTDLLIVTEAPIDLMSHASIAADFYGRDWMQDHRISTGCLWNGAIDRYLEGHPQIKRLVFAVDNDYWCSGNGSYHSLIPGAAEGFGLQWESISTDDPQAVVDTLASGKLIVALMSKGHFTSSGHFMVLRGVTSEGKILVADPASKKRSEQEWDISIILDEARKGAAAGGPLWAIY